MNLRTGVTDHKKVHEEVKILVVSGCEDVEINLRFKHRLLSREANVNLITDKSPAELFPTLKDKGYVVEITENAIVFFIDDLPYPAYASLYCLGEYNGEYKRGRVEGKYEYNFTAENYFKLYYNSSQVQYNFPVHFITEYIREDEKYAYKVNCTFEQLTEYYKRTGEYFISAENGVITIRGLNTNNHEGEIAEYLSPIKIIYNEGMVAIELAEV